MLDGVDAGWPNPAMTKLVWCELSPRMVHGATSERAIPPLLLRAYRQTDYRVGGITVRIGRCVPGELFDAVGARVAVLVTAWNPLSRRMPEGWNHRMMRRMRQHLRRFVVLNADGSLRHWREAMLLVAAEPRRVIPIAARFRQRAVVILHPRRRARLWLLSPRASCAGRSRSAG